MTTSDDGSELFAPLQPLQAEQPPLSQASTASNVVSLTDLATRKPSKLRQALAPKPSSSSKRKPANTGPRVHVSKYDELRPLVLSDYRTGMYSDEALRKKYGIRARTVIPKWVKAGNWKRDLSKQIVRERAILEVQENAQETLDNRAGTPAASQVTPGSNEGGAGNLGATKPPPAHGEQADLSDADLVKLAASAQLGIIRQHRDELKTLRALIGEISGELRTVNAIAKDARGLKGILTDLLMLEAGQSVAPDMSKAARERAALAVARVLDIGNRADIVRKLSGALKEAIPLERLCYGLETSLAGSARSPGDNRKPFGSKPDSPRPMDSTPLEERIRQYTAEATATQSRTIEPSRRPAAA